MNIGHLISSPLQRIPASQSLAQLQENTRALGELSQDMLKAQMDLGEDLLRVRAEEALKTSKLASTIEFMA